MGVLFQTRSLLGRQEVLEQQYTRTDNDWLKSPMAHQLLSVRLLSRSRMLISSQAVFLSICLYKLNIPPTSTTACRHHRFDIELQ